MLSVLCLNTLLWALIVTLHWTYSFYFKNMTKRNRHDMKQLTTSHFLCPLRSRITLHAPDYITMCLFHFLWNMHTSKAFPWFNAWKHGMIHWTKYKFLFLALCAQGFLSFVWMHHDGRVYDPQNIHALVSLVHYIKICDTIRKLHFSVPCPLLHGSRWVLITNQRTCKEATLFMFRA